MSSSDICFVSYNLYSYLNPGSSENAGGAERQQYLIATELAARGYDVSAVVGDHGQDRYEVINQIDVWRAYQTVGDSGYKSLRGLLQLPRQITTIFLTMYNANAKTYYTRSSIYYPLLFLYSKLFNCSYVCALSHDRDVELSSIDAWNPLFRKLYLRSLNSADTVIAQTKYQRNKLWTNYGIGSIVIPNGYVIPDDTAGDLDYFLWVGRAAKNPKNPELFLELSKELPEVDFVMIVAPGQNNSYFESLRSQAQELPNVRFKGFVPPNEIESYYRDAIALINTSTGEGFPNTFLEAWCVGTPVLSLYFDLDGLLDQEQIGVFSGDFRSLIDDAKQLVKDEEMCQNLGYNAREYVESNHSINTIVDLFEEYIM